MNHNPNQENNNQSNYDSRDIINKEINEKNIDLDKIEKQKHQNINKDSNKKTFIILFSVIFVAVGLNFFMFLGFLSTAIYYDDEFYEENEEMNELINKGENTGYIFKERKEIDNFDNINKIEKKYNPIKISDNYNTNEKIENLKPYLYTNQTVEPVLIEHGISSYMTKKGTEPLSIKIDNPQNKPVVCIQDWFNDGDNHGEYISAYIQSLYDGPIYLIDNNSIDFNMLSSLDFYEYCDVVNMSIGYSGFLPERKFLDNFGEIIEKKDTIFIYAAGNDYFEDSENEQKLTYFKNKIKKSKKEKYEDIQDSIPNYFIGVTQGLVSDEYEYDNLGYRIYSGGKGVDLIVLNGDTYVDYEKLSGTSFATPVVTAMAANLLTAGVPKDEILNYLKSDYILVDEYQVQYPIVLVDDIQEKVNNLKFENNLYKKRN